MKRTTRAVQEACEEESDFENIDLSDIEDKSDKSVSNDSKPKYIPEGQEITYCHKIIISENEYKTLQKITKKEFNKLDFNKTPFIEQIIHYKDQPLYVHPFFDIDDIKDTDEYGKLIKWLDSLKPVFGKYSIGGYCNNEEMAAFGYKLIAKAEKYASLHISFYQTAIDADEIHLMGKRSTKNMWPKIDESIYTIQNPTKKDTQKQGMRFVLSNKVYGDPRGVKKDEETAGYILKERLPHTCTYQVWGGERIVSREEWSKIFTIAEEEKPKRNTGKNTVKKTTKIATRNTNVEIEDGNPDLYAEPDYVIPVDEDVVLELLNEFEPTHAWLEQIGCLLMHSPFDKETVERLLKEWYFQEGTDHNNKDTVDAYVNKYYEMECTNRWLFSIIKKIPDVAKREEWRCEFISKGIDPDIEPDPRDDFSLSNIRKRYNRVGGKGIDAMRFMNDLKKIAVLIEPDDDTVTTLVAVKCYNRSKKIYRVKVITENSFLDLLRKYNIGYCYKNGKKKQINAAMVYNEGQNKECLVRKTFSFYDPDPDAYSYFHGYDYKELDDYDEDIISPFLNHIRENIANGNEELYNYILNWVSYILQNPVGKTGSCLVITGEQGTGKNTFTDVICNLMNRYSVRNLTDIGHLVGRFNSVVENNKLIVCNEMASADRNIRLNSDALKSIITDKETGVESKYVEVRFVQNVVNLIILSNHFDPVKIEKLDRRYVVCNTNDSHANDRKYFGALLKTFTEEFYQNLFTYFMKRNLDDVDIGQLPNTEAKQILVDANKSTYELFIQDFIIDFKKGFIIEDAYTYYNKWAFINGFITKDKKVEKTAFCKNVLPFMDKKQIRSKEDGTRKWAYKLKGEKEKYFVLDKYEHDEDEEHVEEGQEHNEKEACNEAYEDFKAEVYRKCVRF